VHPDWSEERCAVAVHAAFGLMNSVADHRANARREDQFAWLCAMALQSLGVSPR
jgi:hypothetical protein